MTEHPEQYRFELIYPDCWIHTAIVTHGSEVLFGISIGGGPVDFFTFHRRPV